MVIDMLASTYKREAIPMVLTARFGALDGKTPEELMAAGDARRVYDWAVGLADGVMG